MQHGTEVFWVMTAVPLLWPMIVIYQPSPPPLSTHSLRSLCPARVSVSDHTQTNSQSTTLTENSSGRHLPSSSTAERELLLPLHKTATLILIQFTVPWLSCTEDIARRHNAIPRNNEKNITVKLEMWNNAILFKTTVYILEQKALSVCFLLCWTGVNWFMGRLSRATLNFCPYQSGSNQMYQLLKSS